MDALKMSIGSNNISAIQLNLPIATSHQANELEAAMVVVNQQVFIAMLDALADMARYGTPFLGSRTVVERFTKLNGLAVLRRDDGGFSDRLMAIILANWLSLASERGVGFFAVCARYALS